MGIADESSTPSSRRYDGSRRQAEARARRLAVIDAARALFLARGYGDTSIEQIARDAEVSVQTVYAAFGSKPGILAAVVDVTLAGDDQEMLMRDRPEVDWLGEIRDPEQWLRRAAAYACELHLRSAELLHLVESVAGADPALAELNEALHRGRRVDSEFAVEQSPLEPAAVGLTTAQAADLLSVLGGPSVWIGLVVEMGWTPERFETWLGDLWVRELVPD